MAAVDADALGHTPYYEVVHSAPTVSAAHNQVDVVFASIRWSYPSHIG